MKTSTNNTAFAIATFAVATLVACFSGQQSQAQQCQNPQQPAPQPVYIAPAVVPPVVAPASEFYFGFNVQLIRTNWGGSTLRIVSVSPGSPAQQAGLEVGDEIQSVNGQTFSGVSDSFQAVRLLNRFVATNTIGGPSPAQGYYVDTTPSGPVANMIVRDVRTGHHVSVIVRPTPTGYNSGPAPAAHH